MTLGTPVSKRVSGKLWRCAARNQVPQCSSVHRGPPRIGAVAGLVALLAACQPPAPQPEVTVTIPRGASFDAAVESLVTHRVVTRPGWFRIYARLQGVPGHLKSGVYEFRPGERWSMLVAALRTGRGVEIRFTLREALPLWNVADVVAEATGVPREAFLAAARAEAPRRALGIADVATSVEGFLFPTTYTVSVGTSAQELVRVMTREFEVRWRPEWNARLDSLGWTRYEAVTLASIIQAEMRYGPDARYISAVYHNRLDRGMPLQADPTVSYAHGRHLRRVYEKHLEVRSPYNTYLHRGLPPGPIGQPGVQSLIAALYPADAPYLYFVAGTDGKHVFSVTYREHLAAISKIRRARRRRR